MSHAIDMHCDTLMLAMFRDGAEADVFSRPDQHLDVKRLVEGGGVIAVFDRGTGKSGQSRSGCRRCGGGAGRHIRSLWNILPELNGDRLCGESALRKKHSAAALTHISGFDRRFFTWIKRDMPGNGLSSLLL